MTDCCACENADSQNMSTRAKLSRGKKVAFDPEAASHAALRGSNAQVVVLDRRSVGDSVARWTKTIAGFAALALFLVTLVYVGLSATLMTSVPSDGSMTERIWVARGTFTGGTAPKGALVYASKTTAKPTNFVDKVLEGFIGAPEGLVAEVVAGPYGTVSSTGDKEIVWEGKVVKGYKGDLKGEHLLNKEYLAECIQGSCTPGELIYVPMGNISGEAQSIVSLSGVSSIKE